MQLKELNNRFNKVSTKLIPLCGLFESANSFVVFDRQKLIQHAQFYPRDFSVIELHVHEDQFQN